MLRTFWCSALGSTETEDFAPNCTVPNSQTGKSFTHSIDKEKFCSLSLLKYFGPFQGCIYIQAGHSAEPLWLQLRVIPVQEPWLPVYLLYVIRTTVPLAQILSLLCYTRSVTLACWPLLITLSLSLTRSLSLPLSHRELQSSYWALGKLVLAYWFSLKNQDGGGFACTRAILHAALGWGPFRT